MPEDPLELTYVAIGVTVAVVVIVVVILAVVLSQRCSGAVKANELRRSVTNSQVRPSARAQINHHTMNA